MKTAKRSRTVSWIKTVLPLIALVAIGVGWFGYNALFGPSQRGAEPEQFTVSTGRDDSNEVAEALLEKGLVKSVLGFRIALLGPFGGTAICVDCIAPGAYKLSKSMSAWEIARAMEKGPYMKWIVIPEGLRKEQIADLLAGTLHWNSDTKQEWIEIDTTAEADYIEGVYFPETYLIPVDEEPRKVAERLRAKFNEKFASFAREAERQNIKWTTLVKVASLVQREAADKNDMPLVAGILWNRLLDKMRLQLDATVQYARDTNLAANDPETAIEWWAALSSEDKQIDSPFNTYRYEGLPPRPIANPGIDAIRAALYPADTSCVYYIHDRSGTIHCSKTYEGHLANINQYLR